MRRTKIVCTVGPAIDSEEMLRKIVEAGADVLRLNFSHETPREHRARVQRIRSVEEQVAKPLTILQDLPGPKIRIGSFREGPIYLAVGGRFTLTTEPVEGDKNRVSVNYPLLAREVQPGQHLLLADGLVELIIDEVAPPEIRCSVVLGGPLSNQKGISVPHGALSVPAFTDVDRSLLLEGLDMGVSMAALSFVRSVEDIARARNCLDTSHSDLPVMAKIEKPEAVAALSEILGVVDAVMVARGDLGVEIPFPEVPLVQKDIINQARATATPVITATQMLRSMVESPRPTRAEAADVANAVLDGTDAVMLSEESAMGAYPVEAVEALAAIAEAAEQRLFEETPFLDLPTNVDAGVSAAIGHSACVLSRDAGAEAIVCCTRTGSTARNVARHRPNTPIIAVSPNIETVRRMGLIWGVKPVLCDDFRSIDGMVQMSMDAVRDSTHMESGARVVIAGGSLDAGPGFTDFLRVAVLGSKQ
ncbi:MAG: pyruvate kinase [Candidatus Latescibacteria bacterium]|jgi:pyruvate kinase|nr:pyruvate kinase [Candidatus Latescibacterota bacterium]